MSLTPKQARFVEEYLIDLNATQAAIRAGYSEKNADKIGPELLGKTRVAEAIAEAMADRSERTKIDADWVLMRLADEVMADLAELYDENGGLKPISEWPLIWRQGLVSRLDVHEDIQNGTKVGQVTKVRLSDRIRRLELIGKHVNVQAFAERKEIGGIGGGPIEVNDLSLTEVARRIAFVLAKASQD